MIQKDNLPVLSHNYDTDRVSVLITAQNALFADPLTRVGGERMSYMIPTYEALKGIMESIYWKPTFEWVIDKCRVMNPITFETKSLLMPRLLRGDKDGRDRAFCTYLADVAYQVEAHIEWRMDKPELEFDRNSGKHFGIAQRAASKGGRFDIFLGKREGACYGYVTPCTFGEGKGYYDYAGSMQFGMMLHGITYPNQQHPEVKVRFWLPQMDNGIITFTRPDECDEALTRTVKKAEVRPINYRIRNVDEEYREVMSK